jgi:hypothetical protein
VRERLKIPETLDLRRDHPVPVDRRPSEAHQLREEPLRQFCEWIPEQKQGHKGSDEGNGHDSQQPWTNRDPPHSFHNADGIREVR